jgi:aconitase A
VRAVIAESFERIHRSNLVGMGVLPLQFALDVPAQTDLEEVYVLLSDGEEAEVWTFDEGWAVE